MKISVIIPAYNSQQTIARALESIFKQTRPVDEILVVDDGSADETAAVVRTFGNAVTLIRQENAGVSIARNTGIQAAKNNWIAFLDADDEWLPEKIQMQTEHLNRHSELKWTYTNLLWTRMGKCRFQQAHALNRLSEFEAEQELFDDYFKAYINGFFASTITLLIHKTLFKKVGLFEPGMKRAQDNDLWFRIAYQYPRVGYLPAPLAVYHQDTPGSSTKLNDSVEFMVNLVQRHEALSKQHNRYDAFRPCLAQMLQEWIRSLAVQHRHNDADRMLTQFSRCLPKRFRREIRFRLLWPPVTNTAANRLLALKNGLKG